MNEESLKHYRDLKNSLDTALAEGRAEGLTKGRAEGLTKGRAEGLTKGRAEGTIETLIKFIEAGVPDSTIKEATGISQDELNRLKKRR